MRQKVWKPSGSAFLRTGRPAPTRLVYAATAVYVARFVVVAREYRARATHGPREPHSILLLNALPMARVLALVGLVLAVSLAIRGRKASKVVALSVSALAALAVVLVAWGPTSLGIDTITATRSPWDTSGFAATLVLNAAVALGFGALATLGRRLDG